MKVAVFFLYAVALMSYAVNTQVPQLLVKPSVCITEKAGDLCQFEVEIVPLNLPQDNYCLDLSGEILRCLQATEFPLKISITLFENSELSLINSSKEKVLSQPLLVKSQQIHQQRRRLRNPWSLF